MVFEEEVYRFRRIVLLRLERAASGAPVSDAPEVDERGWKHDPATTSYPPAAVHGPAVGMPQGRAARVKLERSRLEAGAQLFVSSRDDAIVQVTSPASGSALAADGVVQLQAGTGRWNERFAAVEVRHGSSAGPVIFEFGVRVFAMIELSIEPWLVTVSGRTGSGTSPSARAPTTTVSGINDMVEESNRIWRPIGIRFAARPTGTFTINLDVAGEINYHSGGTGGPGTTVNGTAVASGDHGEFWSLRSTAAGGSHTANRINVYWVRQFTDVGVPAANSHDLNAMTWGRHLDAATHGIVMKDGANGNDLAHELGHFLSLEHADMDDNSLEDVIVLRRLMYAFRPFTPARSYRRNVGYGNNQRGALITLRNKAQYTRDSEFYDARRRARNPY